MKAIICQLVVMMLVLVGLPGGKGLESDQQDGSVKERILNGKDAKAGQFPYQVLLAMTLKDGNHSACGGSLITSNRILTAAHCCVDVTEVTAYLGLVKVSEIKAANSTVEKRTVPSSDIVVHPNYNPTTIANDICILKLSTPVQSNGNISTIALPTKSDNQPSQYDFQTATISGWGQTNNFEGLHDTMQYSTVVLKPHLLCSATYTFINKVSTSQLCSGKLPYTGPCHGDSGGPLTVKDQSGKNVEIGLVSWGTFGCMSGMPVVYTYVPAFLPWIQENIA